MSLCWSMFLVGVVLDGVKTLDTYRFCKRREAAVSGEYGRPELARK